MTTDTARAEALAWLAGRLRFEQLLDRLRTGTTEVADRAEVPKAA